MTKQLHLVLHPVRVDRADEFERFITEVVRPAVGAQRPHLDERWRVMRSRTDQTRIGQGHLEASSSVDRQPQWLVERSRKITGITSRSGHAMGHRQRQVRASGADTSAAARATSPRSSGSS